MVAWPSSSSPWSQAVSSRRMFTIARTLSYVLEGTFGVRVGDEVATVSRGSYVYKPRGSATHLLEPRPNPWPAARDHLAGRFRAFLPAAGRAHTDSGSGVGREAGRTW